MKKVLLMMCLVAGFGVASAQDEVSFSDEELTKYATVMVWGELEKKEMTKVYNGWISENEILKPKRFSDMRKAKGDSLKLQELGVNETELAAFNGIQTKFDSLRASFLTEFKGEIKEKIGNGLYNKVKKALKADAELKGRYQTIYDGLLEEQKTEEESED